MSSSRRIDLVVTDLGGTLVKTDDAIMAAVRRAAAELGIPEDYADPVYDVFGTSIWEYIHAYLPEGHKDRTNDCHRRFWELFPYIADTDHDIRQGKKAGGQAVRYRHKIQAQDPHYLLDSVADLCGMVGE